MRNLWRNFGALPAVACLLFSTAGAAERPNILWLTSEDHGPHMGCYGDKVARTPNVDALAAKGMTYRCAWSCVPVCAPARTAIISGMYPSSTGALHMRSLVAPPRGARMLPELMREAGYYCTNSVKQDYNFSLHRDLWDESSKRAHWKRRRPGQPFFAVFNSTQSHESQIRRQPRQLVTDPDAIRLPAYHPESPEVRGDWAQYYDTVAEADADAGKRIQELEDAGLSDDTIVFYFADHGSGMPRHKRWPSNSGLQVPLVAYFPEKWRHLAPNEYEPGKVSDRLVNFVDLAPTMLSLVGKSAPAMMQGHAFAGPHESEPPEFLFGERGRMDERTDVVRSATDGRYVYLRNYMPHVSQGQHVAYGFETPSTRVWKQLFDDGKANAAQAIYWATPKSAEELYNLRSDPDEVNNLADSPEHRSALQRLRQAHQEHAAEIRDVCFLPEGDMHARAGSNSPYDMARDDAKYPFGRVFAAAELAAGFDVADLPRLRSLLQDDDAAVRYWAAMGMLFRGAEGVQGAADALNAALADRSPYARIAAALALAQFGDGENQDAALATLARSAMDAPAGYFERAAALEAIDALGPEAESLAKDLKRVDPNDGLPHDRFNTVVPRLIDHIVDSQNSK